MVGTQVVRALLFVPFLCLPLPAIPLFAAPEPVVVPGHFAIKNAKDPVDAKTVKKGLHADWMGVRVRFSVFKNIETFKKDPKKYVDKLGFALVDVKENNVKGGEGKVVRTVLDLQNKMCVVNPKEEASAKTYAEKNGVRVRVCCAKCRKHLRGNWSKAAEGLGYDWVAPVIDLRNTRCPVTAEQCYPSAPIWLDVDGIRIRVCCDHCAEEIPEHKERVFRALGVNPTKLKAKLLPAKKS